MAAGYSSGGSGLPVKEELLREAMAVIAAGSKELEKDAEAPPEDLELRKQLEELSKQRGQAAGQELGNAAKILSRLAQDSGNAKLHEMRRDVLERTVGEGLFFAFEAAGFTEKQGASGAQVFGWRGLEAAEQLKVVVHEVQRAADQLLDPDTVTFAQVSELVQNGRTLPGIKDVNDKVDKPVPPKASELTRPKKPWEK
eukprot:TRINITY_DN43385_c0_g1_i1.p1 TRINITY_DN43385_c0_g1~~TRINITY_DN43385_c0_g1_i1.p1  ORF type:complete len:212 (-),score=72.08 TRINITY_DN43385_c0_g1_i1:5-598(-)